MAKMTGDYEGMTQKQVEASLREDMMANIEMMGADAPLDMAEMEDAEANGFRCSKKFYNELTAIWKARMVA